MNRSILTPQTLAVDFEHTTHLSTPLFSIILALVLTITSILFYIIFVNPDRLADTAVNSAVYLIQDDEYVQTSASHGEPERSESTPSTDESQPSFALWHPYAQHDLWQLVYFGTDHDGLHAQHDVDLTLTPVDKGMVIAEPTESLQAGTYCFYEKEWVDQPAATAHYCFEIEA